MSLSSTETETPQKSSVATSVSTAGFRMPSLPPRFVKIAVAFGLFCLLDLLVVRQLNPSQQNLAIVSSILSAVVILLVVYLLPFFERQQEKIDLQSREIETLHAMDTAIVSELDLPRLLEVAVLNAVRAVDGEAAGVAIFHPSTGKLMGEQLRAVGLAEAEAERLRYITRSGRAAAEGGQAATAGG
ncbi:MAG: hypothetical protein V4671_27730, partial [Armatimonadota bacterium]